MVRLQQFFNNRSAVHSNTSVKLVIKRSFCSKFRAMRGEGGGGGGHAMGFPPERADHDEVAFLPL